MLSKLNPDNQTDHYLDLADIKIALAGASGKNILHEYTCLVLWKHHVNLLLQNY